VLALADFAAAQAAEATEAAAGARWSESTATKPPRGKSERGSVLETGALGRSSVATDAQATYEQVGDARKCKTAVTRRPNAKPGFFNTPILKEFQSLMHEIGGSGVSLADQTKIFKFFEKYDKAIADAVTSADNNSTATGGPTTAASKTGGKPSSDTSAAAGGASDTASAAADGSTAAAPATGRGASANASAAAGVSTAAASATGGGASANASAATGWSTASETRATRAANASAAAGGSTAVASATGGGASASASAVAGGSLAIASTTGRGASANASAAMGGSTAAAAAELSSAWGRSRPTADTTSVPSAPFITGVFRSANALRNALRDDLDDAVLAAGWRKCVLVQGGVEYVAFFRSALDVALRVLREAGKVQLRRDAAEVGDRREHAIDGEVCRAHQDVVDSISSGNGFVLGI